MTLCKGEDGLRQRLALYQVYDNFYRLYASLCRPMPQPVPTNGTGSARTWQPQTPVRAAGWTDQVWSLQEVLLFGCHRSHNQQGWEHKGWEAATGGSLRERRAPARPTLRASPQCRGPL